MKPYRTRVERDDEGRLKAIVQFAFPGVGNTPQAEAIKGNGLRSARRAIAARADYPFRCVITDNKIDSLNRTHSLTVVGMRKEEQ